MVLSVAVCDPRRVPVHLLLDVFTDRPFTGNPLAVVIDPGGLSDEAMQVIAGELNLSETVFLWPPEAPGRGWRTRIFTPGTELPFAGHPTIGAAFALVAQGHVRGERDDGEGEGDGARDRDRDRDRDGDTVHLVLDEVAGPVPVEVHLVDGAPVHCRFTAPRIPAAEEGRFDDLAEATGLRPSDLHPAVPPATWSAGVPFTVIPVVDLDALGRARPSSALTVQAYVVTPVDGSPDAATRWQARMFAPALGIPEDPATGAAAAAMAGFLADLDPARAEVRSWILDQGVEMGRPSRIEVTVRRDAPGGAVAAVEIGGTAVIVGSGRIDAPLP